jgi:serine/threonine-protein kinase HipA
MPMTNARVVLWGRDIGAVSWLADREIGVFQYEPAFVASGIQLAPIMMPLARITYEFPALPRNAFKGLPGLLADALPDAWGNAVIDSWLASQGRAATSFDPVERLCYIGARGMGALEFEPAQDGPSNKAGKADVAALVELASTILDKRAKLGGAFTGKDDRAVIEDILRVGASAGGARAKALLAWNPATKQFRSGQVKMSDGSEHWLIKFDGVSNNRDKELADPKGYGRIEYAYHLMAADAGITMSPCQMFEEGGRAHFMTKRFDRDEQGRKRHMQSLAALAHFDYTQPASYSYEQAIAVIRQLSLPPDDIEQQVRRAIFNVVARNQDDHVKNIAFLMDRTGNWRLSPAYDVSYAWNPNGTWTGRHQMSINAKRDDFERADLVALAIAGGIKTKPARDIIEAVIASVRRWPEFAKTAGVASKQISQIGAAHRLNL